MNGMIGTSALILGSDAVIVIICPPDRLIPHIPRLVLVDLGILHQRVQTVCQRSDLLVRVHFLTHAAWRAT